jgi:ketosteroid isomerase-like protein
MKRTIIFLTCMILSALSLAAQTVDRAAALKEAVETERSFSKTAELKGIRDSFLAFVADDGILFRPTAVNGKKWLLDHPTPPSTSGKRPLLSWQPIFADVAGSGEMAYTTGPWQFRQDIKDEKPVAFGHFITVWKKQADNSWKFAIDLGVSHPEPTNLSTNWEPVVPQPLSKVSSSPAGAKQRQELMDTDNRFSNASVTTGAEKALRQFAAEKIRLYRDGKLPFIELESAVQGLWNKEMVWSWKPAFADVSTANDLGYTYGSYEVRDGSKALTDKGNYLRIWKRIGNGWKVVVDVADPLPLEEKKN